MAIQFVRHNTPPFVFLIYGVAVFLCGFEYTAKPNDLMIEAAEYEAF